MSGTCPKCDGSTRRPVPESYSGRDLRHIYGYDAETDTFPCNNCGGQTKVGRYRGFGMRAGGPC